MSLDDMIILYVKNPTKELSNQIENKLKSVSSISIFNTLSHINEIAKNDEKNKEKYIKISEKILDYVKKIELNNYQVDETGRLKPVQKK